MTTRAADNYVKLVANVPKRLRVDRWAWEDRPIRDPKTLLTKTVRAIVLHVTQEDGRAVDTVISFMARKAQEQMAPLIDSGLLFTRTLEVVWRPADYRTEYEIGLI